MAVPLKILTGLIRVGGVYQASLNIHRVCASDKKMTVSEKASRIFLDVVYIAAEAGSLGAARLGYSRQALLNWDALVGGVCVARDVRELLSKENLETGDYIDFLGVLAFRVSRVTNTAAILELSLFGIDRAGLARVSDFSAMAGLVIGNREEIGRRAQNGWNALQTILVYVKESIVGSNPEISLTIDESQEPALTIDPFYANLIRETQTEDSVDRLHSIPELFRFDAVLKQQKCPLSKLSIRFVLAVRGAEPILYYERDAILRHIRENPHSLPSKWPANIPLSEEFLEQCPELQQRIDDRLEILLNQFKDIKFNVVENQTVPQLARAIGISDPARSDKELAKRIRQNFSSRNVKKLSSMSVFTIPYAFSKNGHEKPTRIITLQTNSYKKSDVMVKLQNQNGFLRAILGSSHPSDQAVLDEFSSGSLRISAYISLDLQETHVNPE
jgi:hypothetical protein